MELATQQQNRETSQAKQPALPEHWVGKIFRELHGAFGARFTGCYATGKCDASGEDSGIANAQRVWAEKLAGFREFPNAIAHAIACSQEQPHPPTIGEFLALCRGAPRAEFVALPEKRGEMSETVKESLQALMRKASGAVPLENRASWAVVVLERCVEASKGRVFPVPMQVEKTAVEALQNLGAMHMAPAEYIAMQEARHGKSA